VVTTSNDDLVLLGGHDGGRYLNDVWSIHDPAQAHVWNGKWELMTSAAPWEKRYGHAAVINSMNSIFVIGGFFADKASGRVECFNDVWVSEDLGVTWTSVVRRAAWSGRYQHAAAVNKRDELFVVGGLDVDLERYSDTWRSKDSGRTWSVVDRAGAWTPRYEHAVVVDRKNSLYVIGGMSTGDQKFNDVWRSERTCFDDVHCDKGRNMVCCDGSQKNFEGMANPICANICDHRIFDKCKAKEACVVRNHTATCHDPCEDQKCGKGEVCEVAERNGYLPKNHTPLQDATAFCLACLDSQTKFACDKLLQCIWSAGKEACLTKCKAMFHTEKDCGGKDRCEWKHGECNDKEGGD